MRRPRRNHTTSFKAKVAIAALKGDEMLATLTEKFDVPSESDYAMEDAVTGECLRHFYHGSREIGFRSESERPARKDRQQALEIDFLAGALGRIGTMGFCLTKVEKPL